MVSMPRFNNLSSNDMSDLMICLMGPTASGKTDIACKLAKQFPLEIISVDSAMIYQHMDIGTSKPNEIILQRIPHHLVNILSPNESYSAALFCEDVGRLCKDIHERGNTPLLVGGTMMYFNALQQGLSPLPTASEPIRNKVMEEARYLGWGKMHQQLEQVDPISASRIHPNDAQRIQRALEVYYLTGKSLSSYFMAKQDEQKMQHVENIIIVPKDRTWLHHRIAVRFEQMLQDGLIEEVRQLLNDWNLTLEYPSMRSVGYRQVYAYLHGECTSFLELKNKGIAATRQLAKRQLTWLRHWPNGTILYADGINFYEDIMAIVEKILDNKRI